MREFARITKKYAIIQLGHNRKTGFVPDENSPMGGWLSEKDLTKLLNSYGFEVVEKRLVLERDEEESDIYHILCKMAP